MTLQFDAVVVGAGPAGASAALVMARAGLRVAILERGDTAGSKNVTGGVLHTYWLARLLPDRWKEAPLERPIRRYSATFLGETGAVSLDYQEFPPEDGPARAFSVLRPRFDDWLAQQAVEAGALLIPGTVVDDLLWEGPQVVGVRARRVEGEVRASVVLAADGVNSIIARRAGLRRDWGQHQVGLGLKETLRLPAEVIEERFGIGPGQGLAMLFVGGLPGGLRGGGFLYTNRASLSLGVVLQLDSVAAGGASSIEALEVFKTHPAIRRMLRGSAPLEYSAHLVPEACAVTLPRFYAGGLMAVGDAAGLVLNTGLSVEGMHYALASGLAAGETAVEAIGRGDVGATGLAGYHDRLEKAGVLANFRRFRRMPNLLANPRIHGVYPEAAAETMERWFTVDERPRLKLLGAARDALRSKVSFRQMLGDGIQAWRGLLWP